MNKYFLVLRLNSSFIFTITNWLKIGSSMEPFSMLTPRAASQQNWLECIRQVYWPCKFSQHSSLAATYILQISLMEWERNTIKVLVWSLLECFLWLARMSNPCIGSFELNVHGRSIQLKILCLFFPWYPSKDCKWHFALNREYLRPHHWKKLKNILLTNIFPLLHYIF